jgi:hypothetical protein
MDIAELALPAGVHAAVLTGRDVVTGEPLARAVVWADGIESTCPQCGQPVGMLEELCPVVLNCGAGLGGQLLDRDRRHGCGLWLAVSWQEVVAAREDTDPAGEVAPGILGEAVLDAARELADQRRQQIAQARAATTERLRADLAEALARLGEPLQDGETPQDRAEEVSTGSEVVPGVYREPGVPGDAEGDPGGVWVAWDYEPGGTDPISVYATDLTAAGDA